MNTGPRSSQITHVRHTKHTILCQRSTLLVIGPSNADLHAVRITGSSNPDPPLGRAFSIHRFGGHVASLPTDVGHAYQRVMRPTCDRRVGSDRLKRREKSRGKWLRCKTIGPRYMRQPYLSLQSHHVVLIYLCAHRSTFLRFCVLAAKRRTLRLLSGSSFWMSPRAQAYLGKNSSSRGLLSNRLDS